MEDVLMILSEVFSEDFEDKNTDDSYFSDYDE